MDHPAALSATPTAAMSFVLGDMVASTRHWEAYPDLMPEVLARLDALVEVQLLAHHGQRPPEQGEGDNFVAAFEAIGQAAAFAAALQADLCAETWPGDLPVAVRMAVHTGDV